MYTALAISPNLKILSISAADYITHFQNGRFWKVTTLQSVPHPESKMVQRTLNASSKKVGGERGRRRSMIGGKTGDDGSEEHHRASPVIPHYRARALPAAEIRRMAEALKLSHTRMVDHRSLKDREWKLLEPKCLPRRVAPVDLQQLPAWHENQPIARSPSRWHSVAPCDEHSVKTAHQTNRLLLAAEANLRNSSPPLTTPQVHLHESVAGMAAVAAARPWPGGCRKLIPATAGSMPCSTRSAVKPDDVEEESKRLVVDVDQARFLQAMAVATKVGTTAEPILPTLPAAPKGPVVRPPRRRRIS